MKIDGMEFRERMLALAANSTERPHEVIHRASAYARFVAGELLGSGRASSSILEPWQCVSFGSDDEKKP